MLYNVYGCGILSPSSQFTDFPPTVPALLPLASVGIVLSAVLCSEWLQSHQCEDW